MTSDVDDILIDELSSWHAKLTSGEATEADGRAFIAWLAQSPRHQAEFDRLKDILGEIDTRFLAEDAPVALLERAPAARTPRRQGMRDSIRFPRMQPRFLQAAAAVFAMTILGGWWLSATLSSRYERTSTVVGEQRTITLPDGSEAILNTATSLAYRINHKERSIRLTQGEAFFQVHKNPDIPFVVLIDQGEVRVVGTAFNIRSLSGVTTISVAEGIVAVTDATGRTDRLLIGDRATMSMSRMVVARSVDNPDTANAWTRRQLVYQNLPLHAVAEDLSRYFPGRIVTVGHAADVEVSAVINLDDRASVLAALSKQLSVHISEDNEGTVFIHAGN